MRFNKPNRLLFACCLAACPVAAALAVGPDVIVGNLQSTTHYGSVGPIRAYSIGTESCNIGTENLLWESWNSNHPVIAQNLYRLRDGRLTHIGLSWLKHGYTALTLNLCSPPPCNGEGGSVLGVGCSDPYGSSLNGYQPVLGPRSEVNALTGVFPYPFGLGWNQSGDAIYKRLQVRHSDLLDPEGSLFFIEGHYVTADDAAAGNKDNNASYRRITISSSTWSMTLQGSTERMKPAIMAWYDHGNGANQPDPGVNLVKFHDEEGGTFWMASKVTDLGGGTWRYDYGIQNLNSHQSGGSFSVPVADDVAVSNVGFHAPFYHSGEPYDGSDWTWERSGGMLTWSSPETYAENPDSNALRWGTMYNFWFDCNQPPESGQVTLGVFRPAANPDRTVLASVPSVPDCPADLDGDGSVGLGDLSILLTNFGTPGGPADGDLNGDGEVGLADLSMLLADFGTDCD